MVRLTAATALVGRALIGMESVSVSDEQVTRNHRNKNY